MYCKERKVAGKYNWETPCIIRCSDFRNVKMQKSVSQVQVNIILSREGEKENSLMVFKAKSQNKYFFFHVDLNFFIEVELIYNVLVSGIQQSDSDIYIYICVCVCMYILLRFFSIIGDYKLLTIVPYAVCFSVLYIVVYIC